MIPINKLAKLAPRHRMRKCALVLQELERELLSSDAGTEPALLPYARELAALVARTPELPEAALAEARRLEACCGLEDRAASTAGEGDGAAERLRAVDSLRHALLAATGQAPADWDLIDPRSGSPDPASRRIHPGMRVYLEDLRSPFNVGSIFRTADAFGVEELLLSPACADPGHPRAQRSAMGAVELLPWRRLGLPELSGTELAAGPELSIFALELGGEDIGSFSFPEKGIVILGSEELGISREARALARAGIVSIPMSGAKGSLNVAVAFGILMHAWSESLRR